MWGAHAGLVQIQVGGQNVITVVILMLFIQEEFLLILVLS